MMPLGRIPQIVQHEPRLHACLPPFWIKVEDPMKILRPIHDDRRVAALTA
jgi:hypothetical protein